ncbi:MAG: hypothetical protein JST80_11580 [Bdellovibrionales bacterium]|nr:hypothetical protein [Bdellovibrionales bacterium]
MHQFNEPWHQRLPNFEEERRYFRLIALHQLTQRWMREITPSGDGTYRLERTARPELEQNLWLLEKIKLDVLPPDLHDIIDASKVSEFLVELEELIWIVQSSTLENMISNSKDRVSLINVLEKASWQTGKAYAESKWPHFHPSGLRSYFDAIEPSPLGGRGGFVLERATAEECGFYWMKSPLTLPSVARSPEILTHCQLYHEWIRGFFYGLSRNLRVDILPAQLGSNKSWKINLLAH